MSEVRPIRVCYADPPYPGCAHLYSKPGTPEYHPDAMRWDDPAEHVRLMARLEEEYPDGWALSTNPGVLRYLLPGSPSRAVVGAWCKNSTRPISQYRVGFNWEALIYRVDMKSMRGARPNSTDWIVAGVGGAITSGFTGSKPKRFCFWLFRLLGLGSHPEDEFVDMFPGSGAVTAAWDEYRARAHASRAGHVQRAMFEGAP